MSEKKPTAKKPAAKKKPVARKPVRKKPVESFEELQARRLAKVPVNYTTEGYVTGPRREDLQKDQLWRATQLAGQISGMTLEDVPAADVLRALAAEGLKLEVDQDLAAETLSKLIGTKEPLDV